LARFLTRFWDYLVTFLPVKVLRFKIVFFLFLVFSACGPKPRIQLQSDGSPQAVWNTFCRNIVDHKSIALKGHLSIISSEAFECNFEAFFENPDRFSFAASGPFGVSLARAVLVGDSGFIEIPKRKTFQKIGRADWFYIAEIDNQVNIGMLFRSLFFNLADSQYSFNGQSGNLYCYQNAADLENITFCLEKESCLPQEKSIMDDKDTVRVVYSKWQVFGKSVIFPKIISVRSVRKSDQLQFKINQALTDIDVPNLRFTKRIIEF
jgi:hypothetical protein